VCLSRVWEGVVAEGEVPEGWFEGVGEEVQSLVFVLVVVSLTIEMSEGLVVQGE